METAKKDYYKRGYVYGPLQNFQREMNQLLEIVEPDKKPIEIDIAQIAFHADDKEDVEREMRSIKNQIDNVQTYEKFLRCFEAWVNYEGTKDNRLKRIEEKLDRLLNENKKDRELEF